jgi:hypothetical protein
MILGQKAHTAGDTIRYIVNYTDWLEDGVSLSTATVVLDPAFTAAVTNITISGVTVLTEHNKVAFVMSGGSVNENFTLDVQVTDSRSEVKNDTLLFQIVAP